ncbi:uncharacterized protein CCOS01_06653 [Colletotrichum costaricense]|uniref:Uncharacterized protein n=1 Tax=Colletotrichum costaricense TaxID=1209916 RepID=A0AAI9YYI3_9PEZI|nr:uncharacterized protein CCOS01_06653 [Colletotrichum costaricense]KAK1528819.1 hypothetical protein CCOS01_06653 [Colletotrichum costaricense]
MHFQFLSNSLPSSQSQTPTSFFLSFLFLVPSTAPEPPICHTASAFELP